EAGRWQCSAGGRSGRRSCRSDRAVVRAPPKLPHAAAERRSGPRHHQGEPAHLAPRP
ncbi:MAG: hypothetical protein AVDCRST_MAG90-3102, partial [uncultured Microvirga sp.]